MYGRKQKLLVILVFVLTTLLALFLFMKMENRKHWNIFCEKKVAFELVAELTVDAVSSAYCHRDDLYSALLSEDLKKTEIIRSKILADHPYIDFVNFEKSSPSGMKRMHRIYTVNNRLCADFRIFDDDGSSTLDAWTMTVGLNSRRILSDIQGIGKFSFSPHGSVYGHFFGVKVFKRLPDLRFYHFLASLFLGFFFAFWTRKSLCGISGFFYRSRGLKKLITIFEHAERYSANHSRNVAAIAEKLGAGFGLRRKSLKDLKIAALFHDIGKIAVPVSILNKKGSLSTEEFEIVKRHTADSAQIIQDFEELAHLSDYIRYHHEKMDGSGYPSGLKGEEIPLFSRIIAVADIFEALVGDRPYREPMDPHKALRMMETEMSLDPVVLNILRENFEAVLKILKIKELFPVSA